MICRTYLVIDVGNIHDEFDMEMEMPDSVILVSRRAPCLPLTLIVSVSFSTKSENIDTQFKRCLTEIISKINQIVS